MAISWSWAFGVETAFNLSTEMGWSFANTSSTYSEPGAAHTYTYAGSPARQSFRQDDGFSADWFSPPSEVWNPHGWICVPVYVELAFAAGKHMIEVQGGAGAKKIYIRMGNAGTGDFWLYVGNVFKSTFQLSTDQWSYVSLQYDMSGTTWEGRVYVDGAAVTNLFSDSGETAETTGGVKFGGIGGGSKTAFYGQIVVYDDKADSGEVPLFATRIGPDDDTSEVGAWIASSGGDNYVDTAGDPFVNSTYTEEAAPVGGDNVVTQVTSLITGLGITATVHAATVHSFSSGTGVDVFSSIGDSAGAYADGDTVVPSAGSTKYSHATQTVGFSGASTVLAKFEIV